MWASATYGLSARIGSSISCHTHSYVGFCNFNNMGLFSSNKSCHTHSYVGFCNTIKDGFDKAKEKLSYPLICGLLQPGDWQSNIEIV